MNKLKHYWFRIIESAYRKLKVIKVYKDKFGIKNINMYLVADIGTPRVLQKIELKPEDLFLGPDYLKDNYTLLDTCLLSSPHYGFMKCLLNNGDLKSTDYARRYSNGTLDWRRGYPLEKKITGWKKTFQIKREKALNGDTQAIRIYKNNGKYYIYDGKHRAALNAILGLPILCDEIELNNIVSFYGRYMFEFMNGNDYKKHKAFIEEIDTSWIYK